MSVIAALAVMTTAVACGSGGGAGAPATSPTAADAGVPGTAEYAVGKRWIELVDSSRPTAADPGRQRPERAERTIKMTLLYPADGAPVPRVDRSRPGSEV